MMTQTTLEAFAAVLVAALGC